MTALSTTALSVEKHIGVREFRLFPTKRFRHRFCRHRKGMLSSINLLLKLALCRPTRSSVE